MAGPLLCVLSNEVYELPKRRSLVPKSPTGKRWLILVLSSLPLLLWVTLLQIIPEDQSDIRGTILATIDAISEQRRSEDQSESRVTIQATIDAVDEQRRYLLAELDVLKAEQARGTRQPGSAGDARQAAITDALADLEATTLALELRLARLDNRRPTSTPQLTVVPSDKCQMGSNASFENELVALINGQRTAQGLRPLGSQAQLARSARAHSIDMACRGFFSHTGSNGTAPGDRISGEGYRWSIFSENVARGYGSPQDVITGWMGSPGHRANILSPRVVDVGVGYAYSSLSGRGDYWTAVFAAP